MPRKDDFFLIAELLSSGSTTVALSATDTIAIADSATLTGGAILSVSDALVISDSATLSASAVLVASDSISIADSAVLQAPANLTVADAFQITDLANLTALAYLSTSDTISLSDVATLTTGVVTVQLACSDTITLIDTALLSAPANLSVSDMISIVDSADLVAGNYVWLSVEDFISMLDSATLSLPQINSIYMGMVQGVGFKITNIAKSTDTAFSQGRIKITGSTVYVTLFFKDSDQPVFTGVSSVVLNMGGITCSLAQVPNSPGLWTGALPEIPKGILEVNASLIQGSGANQTILYCDGGTIWAN